jgi:hypothetical protein
MAAGRMPTGRLEPDLSGPVVIASWIVTVRPDLRGAPDPCLDPRSARERAV